MGPIRAIFGDHPLGVTLYRILTYPHPYRVAIARLFLQVRPRVRPHYYICLQEAAKTAKGLGYPRITAVEFGVAGGNGLLALEKYATAIERKFGVGIDIYGFDMGDGIGLPQAQDPRDMPYFWEPGFYRMDQKKLASKLKRAKLILGDIGETVAKLNEDVGVSPIGAIFVDVDYYSSTLSALRIFDRQSRNWLPRVLCYFDDVEVASEFFGEGAAIKQFNDTHDHMKIARTGGHHEDVLYGTLASKIFTLHDFNHPQYSVFFGSRAARQLELE
jgi:hypothetical protein